VLGFEVMVLLPSAAFVSAGGYHHHLAFNVWLGRDVGQLPPHTAGLRHWTVLLASPDEVAAVRARVDIAGLKAHNHETGLLVRDPWKTAVVFSVG
jgi:catechol 2,3-dioxygenase